MKFNYEGNSKSSGIYKIFNTHTNRVYIGQAKSFQQRWYDHKRHLLKSNHQNKFLLNDFNKHLKEFGSNDFLEFHVLEVMNGSTKEERNSREEFWIAQHWDNQQNCYNFKQKAESGERSCFSLTPEETVAKRAIKLKGQKRSPEFCKANRERQLGIKHSAERIDKNRASHLGQEAWNKGLECPQMAGENHPFYGKIHSEETKQKISDSCKGRIPWNKGRKRSA